MVHFYCFLITGNGMLGYKGWVRLIVCEGLDNDLISGPLKEGGIVYTTRF
jgi:hypothetical protein